MFRDSSNQSKSKPSQIPRSLSHTSNKSNVSTEQSIEEFKQENKELKVKLRFAESKLQEVTANLQIVEKQYTEASEHLKQLLSQEKKFEVSQNKIKKYDELKSELEKMKEIVSNLQQSDKLIPPIQQNSSAKEADEALVAIIRKQQKLINILHKQITHLETSQKFEWKKEDFV